jgi:hypothetical protein
MINKLEALYKAFNEDNNLIREYLQYVATLKHSLQPQQLQLLKSGSNDTLNAYIAKVQEGIQAIRNKKDEIKIKQVLKGTQNLQEAISIYRDGLNNPEIYPVFTLSEQLEQFEDKYENFLHEYSRDSFFELTELAELIDNAINNISNLIFSIKLNLQTEYQDESSGILSLFLNSDYTYQEFVEKLNSLQRIYSILCQLLQISEIEFPLQIIKIESGSLWVRLFGEPRVIKIIEDLIKDTASFFYRNYTDEGKIQSLPSKIKTLEEYLDLKKKLEDAGIDTSLLSEELEKSSVSLAQELNSLLSKSKGVEINGELLEIENKNEQKYLRSKQTPLLEGNNETLE